ncbi:MAG: cytochrome P450 [Acidimicrobiia bacterium]|nr:cytochrome P450 [Acidimicrobiia bacterium]
MTTVQAPVDLADPAVWQPAVPHAAFDVDRSRAPVLWRTVEHDRHGVERGAGYWSVTGYDEVRAALRNPTVFSSHEGGIRMEDPSAGGLAFDRLGIVGMDPPEHSGYRLAVNQNFVPRVIATLGERVEAIARDAVERFGSGDGRDLVAGVSAEVPLIVIADLLGVERADRDQFRRWTDTVVSPDDPEVAISRAEVLSAVRDFMAYGAAVLADRRRHPRDDLMTAVAHAEVEGEPMDDAHQAAMWFIFLIGGNETTRNALTGAVLGFDAHPDQLAWVRAEPERWSAVPDEVLRWWSPVNYLRRTVVQDTELGGHRLRAGDKAVLWLSAANRDPAMFAEPHRFEIGRSNAGEHLALGHGTHFCLGAHLARMELRVTLPMLYERLRGFAVDGPAQRVRTNFINGVKALPVRFDGLEPAR